MTQQEPTQIKYILTSTDSDAVRMFSQRPSMEYIRTECGVGSYGLYNADAKLLRSFTVVTNRNGNLKITGHTPGGLESLSTTNVGRLIKQYDRIVKLWPAKLNDARALEKEIIRREDMLIKVWFQAVDAS